jgi:signal transduction histidine kinase
MSAITQIRPPITEGIDPAIVRAAVDASSQALAIVEGDRIAYANIALCHLVGTALPAEMLGGSLTNIIGAEQRMLGLSTKFTVKGREFQVYEVQPRHDSKHELEQSQRLEAMGRLVGGVAHDFNNLLTGILLCCDLLLIKLDPASPLRRYAEEMRRAGSHGTKLIQQLLSIARPRTSTAGNVVCLNEVIGGMGDLLARLIGESVGLQLKLGRGLRSVKMEGAQAEQIILNLVLNARDAMPDGGQISLMTRNCVPAANPSVNKSARERAPKTWVRLEVADTGCGMDRATQARIFEPFFTTKAGGQGNGLGLATVKQIVMRSKGMIEVESRPGKGTRITIDLPGAAILRNKRLKAMRSKV